jgi:hypothetical protein
MHAAHHDRHALRAEAVGDLVTAVDVARHRGDADQVALQVEVDGLDVFVGQHDLIPVARDAGRHRKEAGEGRIF